MEQPTIKLSDAGLEAYVNTLKLQRQQALDDVAMLAAQLAQAMARIRELEAPKPDNGAKAPAADAPAQPEPPVPVH